MKDEDRPRYLVDRPPQPAIRNAMAKVVEREERGLPVYNFTSGNVGKLPFNMRLFSKFDLEVNGDIPHDLRVIAEAIGVGLSESFNPHSSALSYSPAGGTSSIKKLVIRYFREVHDVPLFEADVDNVIVTAGGQRCMAAALRSIRPGTKVFLARWDYSAISTIVEENGCEAVRIRCNDDLSIDLDDLGEKVSDHSVFYISMPNNPSGYVSPGDLEEIISVVGRRGGGVIWDAPYIFTILRLHSDRAVYDRELESEMIRAFKMVSAEHYEDMCILSSLSKTCLMAGLRVGMGTASAHWINAMSSIIGREDLSSPTLSFIIGENMLQRFLDEPSINQWLCEVLASRLSILMEEKLPIILPKNGVFGALYALLDTGGRKGIEFSNVLLNEYGIAVVPGEPFYGGPVSSIRLSLVATPWVTGDEEWVGNVKALKLALRKMNLY